MELVQIQRRLVDYTKSLFMEGFLDAQFLQLQQLQDDSNPDFVFEVVSLFFEDSEKLLNELTIALDQPNVDFKKLDSHVHQLKGSSSSIGAQRVKNACIAFRNYCDVQNIEGSSKQVPNMSATSEARVLPCEEQLEQQIMASGGSVPTIELDFDLEFDE
ncbi:histidine-containing phosphotransfer protein 1-like [Gossypium australe]|uniref:Histidine-containing phosphotransfer protein n=1 Tax=Gossypium australe TaxID=47621 RepID=A0A5B6UD99_9ROSI|nr:histidine-containing phosphotransfer protein 1-like [Gossypium australe]